MSREGLGRLFTLLGRFIEEWHAAYYPDCPVCGQPRRRSGCRIVRGEYLGVVDGHRTWRAQAICYGRA